MTPYKIGLVLGGGFAKGSYQMGFIKALTRYIPAESISCIYASSIGTINGYALSCGKLGEAEYLCKNIDFKDIANFVKVAYKDRIFSKMVDMIAKEGDKISIPLTFSLCRFPKLEKLYVTFIGENSKECTDALKASIAFPIATKPAKFLKKHYIDGGAMDNIPVRKLTEDTDCNLIIVLHCDTRYIPPQEIYKDDKIIMDLDVSVELASPLEGFDIRHKTLVKMFEEGEKYGEKVCDYVFKGFPDIEFDVLRKRVNEFLISDYQTRRKRASFDTFYTFLNQVYYALFEDDDKIFDKEFAKQLKQKEKEELQQLLDASDTGSE